MGRTRLVSAEKPLFFIEGLHVCAAGHSPAEGTASTTQTPETDAIATGAANAGAADAAAASNEPSNDAPSNDAPSNDAASNGADGRILKGLNLEISPGEIHALMGPNGSGKSTLAATLMGSPEYEITSGEVLFKGEDVTDWSPEERAKAGLFLAFQYPQAIVGVSVLNFLRQSLAARTDGEISILQLRMQIMEWMEKLGMDPSFADRFLNDGFSGGEKKRNEILQMAILKPEMAVLDETDSGLDIDALKIVANGIRSVCEQNPNLSVLAITHYQRLLEYLTPDHVHVLLDGRIVDSGDIALARKLERRGYAAWR